VKSRPRSLRGACWSRRTRHRLVHDPLHPHHRVFVRYRLYLRRRHEEPRLAGHCHSAQACRSRHARRRRAGDRCKLDYTDPASIAACADHVLALTDGKLDALFNNGAYGQPGLVEDLPTDVLRAQFEANFFGWHDLTTRLLPAMHEQRAGRIVQCSSVLGFMAAPYRGAYNASKFALEGLTDTLRLELHGSGIQVSSIQPGPIRSRFTLHALNALKANIDHENSRNKALYQKRIAELEEIAGDNPPNWKHLNNLPASPATVGNRSTALDRMRCWTA
jgi:NAD(P)-dependent dehydrogenase (short-subunit alcohol dehydrogenase family)